MDRSQKSSVVEHLRDKITNASLVVITQQVGLTAGEVQDLRNQVRAGGADYKVTKNRLAKLAVTGTSHEALGTYFSGVTAITYSQDPIAAAKVAVNYANGNKKFTVICGILDGKLLDADAVKELGSLPSLDALRAKIVGLLQAVPASVARVISAYSEK